MTRGVWLVMMLAAALAGCGRVSSCGAAPAEQAADPLTVAPPTRPGEVPEERTIVIAFLGDSLTAGLGLTSNQAYPHLIQEMFAAEGYGEVESLNAGISGDTTAGGLRRVEQLVGDTTKILVVALGGNDALRGLTVAQTRANIEGIIDLAFGRGLAVLLAGMEAPTNLGEDYRDSFRSAFTQVSRQYRRTNRVRAVSARGRRRRSRAQPVGRHPSQRAGSPRHRRTSVPEVA